MKMHLKPNLGENNQHDKNCLMRAVSAGVPT